MRQPQRTLAVNVSLDALGASDMETIKMQRYYSGIPSSYLDKHARIGETYEAAGTRLKRQYFDEKKATEDAGYKDK